MTANTQFAFSAHPSDEQIAMSLRHFYRSTFRRYRIYAAVMVVLGALLLPSSAWPFGMFALLLGVAFGTFLPSLTVRMMRRRIGPLFLRSTSYRVDESGIWMGNDQTENLFRWSGIDRVDELPGLLVATLGRSGFCAMPIADLPPERAAAVTAFVRAQVPPR